MKTTIFAFLLAITGCGSDDGNSGDNNSSGTASLSATFSTIGCAAASCHGSDGKSEGTNLHDNEGNPITNLSKSERNLESWTTWVRETAKSPMPTYNTDQYSETDLKADYTTLTGRTE